jgi:hypothetical protein
MLTRFSRPASTLALTLLLLCLLQWTPEHKHKRHIEGIAARFCHGTGLRRLFDTWQRNAHLKKQVVANWRRLGLVKGWNSWRAAVQVRSLIGPAVA